MFNLCVTRFRHTAPAGRYRLGVVDVFPEPSRAVRNQIIAVPILVKERPLPIQRLIGTLSSAQQMLQAFGLTGLL